MSNIMLGYRFNIVKKEMLTLISLITNFGPSYEPLYLSTIELYRTASSSLFQIRAGLLVVELMKEAQAFREAAFILLQMGNYLAEGLVNDELERSLFLEQAAICFLRSFPALPRRFAFYSFMAGESFLKCGLVLIFDSRFSMRYETIIFPDLNTNILDGLSSTTILTMYLAKIVSILVVLMLP